MRVTFNRLADLRSPLPLDALRDIGVSAEDLIADDFGPCPAIAQAGEELGQDAFRHERAGASRPTQRARSVRTAYLTRYRAGERPAWLAAAP